MAGLFRLFSSRAKARLPALSLGRLSCVASVLALAACATPEQKTYDMALADARTDPNLCQSIRYYPLLAQAWQKAHITGDADAQDASAPTAGTLPAVKVTASTAMPDVSFPPYSQRACRMTVRAGDHPPETGYLTVAYFMHNGKVDTSLVKWNSDTAVSQYYDELKAKISKGVDMNNPTLKACMEHYPALQTTSTDPSVQQAAVSLRALLVRHCLADHAALKNLYSDMYFIHR
ncbi:hypothetical protein ASY01nite_09960 [Acetobacter syzygii]|uniref:hypothetical protein n=1 Tax=Acetobacter syzygii TaxID=146476 RepID=UPI0005E33C37|nr:hypothetical protein [Acetobacter syzygii]GAN70240.1 hypothetical protein Absy_005_068 [Acetobacter syzygii]GBR63103.1 hypothetical protein AA0483_0705 [Acetobacter syzygii NRIC 0483]GEL55930.1 hypothetical protein ASY01nite_09960 [Acetobacter syzygii]